MTDSPENDEPAEGGVPGSESAGKDAPESEPVEGGAPESESAGKGAPEPEPAGEEVERESFGKVMGRVWAQPWGKVVAFILVFALGFGVGYPTGVQVFKWQVRRAFTQAFDGLDAPPTSDPSPYTVPESVIPSQEVPGYIDPSSTATPDKAMGMEGVDFPKGTEGSIGALSMRVDEVDCTAKSWTAGRYSTPVTPPEGKQLCVISTQITNNTNAPQMLTLYAMLVDAKGNWYEYDTSNSDNGVYQNLDPAESVKYDVVFVIPQGQQPDMLQVISGDVPYMYGLS